MPGPARCPPGRIGLTPVRIVAVPLGPGASFGFACNLIPVASSSPSSSYKHISYAPFSLKSKKSTINEIFS